MPHGLRKSQYVLSVFEAFILFFPNDIELGWMRTNGDRKLYI